MNILVLLSIDQRQFVYLEEIGRAECKSLLDLLKQFLQDAEHDSESQDSNLYPKDKLKRISIL